MIVSGFTSFSENFVIRCNQITKIFCSKYCITCAFPAKSPCNLGSLAYFAISVLREVQEWETTQNVFKCAVHNGQCEVFSRDPTWAQDVWVWEEYQCRVFCYRLWCDQLCNNITRVQLARLLASRGCVRFARRHLVALGKFHKSTLAHMSRAFDSSNSPFVLLATRLCHSFPSWQLPGELVSLSSVSILSIDLDLWNRSRPSAFVPMSLGFTSVLTDDIVSSFRNTKSWTNKNLVWMRFILRLAPCFVATARAVLLSALACIRSDSPISFRTACAKINSADNAPTAYNSDSPLDKATVPCLRHSLVRRNWST